MSGKITRISENIRTHDENGYKKGDLSYARNGLISLFTYNPKYVIVVGIRRE